MVNIYVSHGICISECYVMYIAIKEREKIAIDYMLRKSRLQLDVSWRTDSRTRGRGIPALAAPARMSYSGVATGDWGAHMAGADPQGERLTADSWHMRCGEFEHRMYFFQRALQWESQNRTHWWVKQLKWYVHHICLAISEEELQQETMRLAQYLHNNYLVVNRDEK